MLGSRAMLLLCGSLTSSSVPFPARPLPSLLMDDAGNPVLLNNACHRFIAHSAGGKAAVGSGPAAAVAALSHHLI
jgi:hypothetical protein